MAFNSMVQRDLGVLLSDIQSLVKVVLNSEIALMLIELVVGLQWMILLILGIEDFLLG